MNTKPKFHVTIMTAQAAFYECKEWCLHGLAATGYDVTYADATLRADAVNIVLGSYCTADTWKSISQQAKHIIIYNWEPAAADHGRFTQRYIRSLQHTHVWDYSRNNVAELRDYAGIQDIHYVPMGYTPALNKIETASEQDIDVLFYGTMYPRRQNVINELRAKGLNVVCTATDVGWVSGEQRHSLIARAKVVLNMHAFDGVHVFEMARISYLLANRKAVVTEVSERTDIDDDLRDAVAHGHIDTLAQLCWDLVHDDTRRHALEQSGQSAFMRRDAGLIMSTAVERYLDLAQSGRVGNQKPLNLSLPRVLQLGSGSINQGYNERWSYRRCNIDARADFAPDIILDIHKPLPFGQTFHNTRFGDVVLQRDYFNEIDAQQAFQRTRNPLIALNNCLELLQEGGTLVIPVRMDMSHAAWSHIQDRRAFSEQSWGRIVEAWRDYGWQTHTFDVISFSKSVNNEYGYQVLNQCDGNWDVALKTPRAIDYGLVTLRKRALTDEERKQTRQARFLD